MPRINNSEAEMFKKEILETLAVVVDELSKHFNNLKLTKTEEEPPNGAPAVLPSTSREDTATNLRESEKMLSSQKKKGRKLIDLIRKQERQIKSLIRREEGKIKNLVTENRRLRRQYKRIRAEENRLALNKHSTILRNAIQQWRENLQQLNQTLREGTQCLSENHEETLPPLGTHE